MSKQQHVIDCDKDPFVPEGWKVLLHKKDGQVEWDMEKMGLYVPPCQQGVMPPVAYEVEKELEGKPVLNANVLDYLIAHPECIPLKDMPWMCEGDFKGEIYFWGTIYENDVGKRSVRCLVVTNGVLNWGYVRIQHDGLLGDLAPAAVHEMKAAA